MGRHGGFLIAGETDQDLCLKQMTVVPCSLKWNSHIRNVCSKANRTLGFLRRNLFSCPQDVKDAAYKSMVRPIFEYESTVWDPHCNGLNDELENVQKRAARFVTSYETRSMTGILEELKWETLQKRRKDNRLILLYKGLKGKARIPTDGLIPKNRRCRNQHSVSLVFQIHCTHCLQEKFLSPNYQGLGCPP